MLPHFPNKSHVLLPPTCTAAHIHHGIGMFGAKGKVCSPSYSAIKKCRLCRDHHKLFFCDQLHCGRIFVVSDLPRSNFESVHPDHLSIPIPFNFAQKICLVRTSEKKVGPCCAKKNCHDHCGTLTTIIVSLCNGDGVTATTQASL